MLSPTLAVYRNLLSNQGFLWLFSVFKRLRNSLTTGLFRPAPQVSATAVLACSTAPGLAPAPNTRNGQQIILKVAKDTESRRIRDYPGCAALASSNCAYPYVR